MNQRKILILQNFAKYGMQTILSKLFRKFFIPNFPTLDHLTNFLKCKSASKPRRII
jgi:hypothetical protein